MHRVLSRMSGRSRTAGLLVAAGLLLAGIGGNTFRAAPQGETKGFLIVGSDLGIHYGDFKEECPGGFENTVEEGYLALKTPAERERLLKPENVQEYANGWKNEYITGPGGENVCNNPKSFMNDPRHPPYRGVKGTVAYGLNLDGVSDGQDFTGVNGEAGIDNQLYRAVGCAKNVRGLGPPPNLVRIAPFLIEISGLDDSKNDDHVQVGIYSTDDTPVQGSDGQALQNQTLSVTRNPRWRATVAGRMVNGQVTTDRVEVINLHNVLSTWGAQGTNYAFEFHGARLRLTMEPDGTLSGVLAAFRPIENIFTVLRCCMGSANVANINCAAEHKTLAMMADGYPDSDTGKNTMISSATNISGMPVFIVHSRTELQSRK